MPQTPKTLRQTLLHGASCSALMVATAAVPQARAGGFRSIGQALAAAPASAAASAAAGLTAGKQAALGAQNLAAATARFRSIQQALAAAATASAPATVPNGMATGGLEIGTGVSTDGGKTVANPTLWNGANLPTHDTTNTSVTVVQTASLAQLTWKTFNVGPKTHLTFNQSAGGSQAGSWIVINTVQDPLANPTQIEGDISATGKVYILNRNGIAFSAGSQINVGSLIAATASIASTQFTQNADGSTNFSLYGAQSGSSFTPTFVPYTDGSGNALASGDITVAAGAVIETPVPSGSSGGGYVMLLGANVANAGAIMTPQGQTVLAGGSSFTLRQGYAGSVTTGNVLATTLGSQVDAANTGTLDPSTGNTLFSTGTVENSGLIMADQGDITMAGHALTQAGAVLSTTTVNTRGTVHLLTDLDDTTASVTLAPGSVTEILPEDNSPTLLATQGTLTALDAQRAANIANSATLNAQRNTGASATNPQLANQSNLPDIQGEGRIELSSGGSVDLAPGALALAQGGQVAVGAGKTVLVERGATIDVSGTDSAVLPASINDLAVSVQPYQLRDSAGNRDGALKSTTLNVDARTLVEIAGSGPYAGNIYTQGGLLEVSGYLGLVPHGITEWTAIGGQVTIQAQSTSGTAAVGGTVITQPGSVINMQGGVVNYAAGEVAQSYVVATDGTIYNVNTAPGNLVYTGIYTGETEVHARWHVTDTFLNPLLTPAEVMDPAYSIGRDAGTLSVYAATTLLQGEVDAGVSVGTGQTGPRPTGVTDPYLLAQTVAPQAGTLAIGAYSNTSSVTIYDTSVTIGTGAVGSAAPVANTALLDSGAIAAAGLAAVTINTGGDIDVTAPLAVADGGTITLIGSTIEVGASLTARGGAMTLTNTNPLSSGGGTLTTAPSISVAGNAVLDARGVWTNAVLDPVHVSGEAFAPGGTVTIQGNGAVDLAPGSSIAVSSGGALLSTGKLLGAAGGSIFISADIQPGASAASAGTASVALDAGFAGYGTSGGGTLSLEAPAFSLGYAQVASGVVAASPALFQSGFSSYVLNGFNAVAVAAGAQITVAEPVYALAGSGGSSVPTGGDPGQVFAVILPATYTPNRSTDAVTQRAGASISLVSSVDPAAKAAGGGPVTIAAGASITVDPGQSISLIAYGQVTMLGTLAAHGGRITAANTDFEVSNDAPPAVALNYQPGTSIWIGDGALLDASGQAIGFVDSLGQRFADRVALAGGSITLGADPATNQPTDSQVIVRPGATLNASGASAAVSVVPGAGISGPTSQPVTLAGAGGTISANSATGVALDGTIIAAAGGSSAAGGVLNLRIDNLPLANYIFPDYLDQPRDIVVSNATTLVQTDATLQPGDLAPADTFGLARLSQAQITGGGFDAVNLSAEDALVFEGNVALSAGRSIAINAGVIGVIGDSVAGATVSIAAPHVSFLNTGAGQIATSSNISTGTLVVTAGLIDFADQVTVGGTSTLTPLYTTQTPEEIRVAGFAVTEFISTGDIRFLGGSGTLGVLQTSGNLAFTAAELLPASGATETVYAGLNDSVSGTSTVSALAGGTISVFGTGGAQQAASVGGTLALVADSIVQDGVIRAPEGEIRLGFDNFADDFVHDQNATFTGSVVLDAGSVTSVSLIGQTIPFGGTVDGVNYLLGGSTAPLFSPIVEIEAEQFIASAGATLDLRGGGTLSGAGFIAGRGGSADVLKTPLLDITGGAAVANAKAQVAAIAPVNTGDAVYAILPSYQGNYAPAAYAAQDSGYTPTVAGEQITLGSQIPGLKPGTYTLLPAYYALLPGGFRVELTSGTVPASSLAALGNFTSEVPVTIGIAGTPIASQVPVAALFTSSANVNQIAQYDTESYNSFESTAGATFGTPRPFLPQDAKTLLLNYPSQVGTATALAIDPSVLLKAPDATSGGYGMTLEITSPNQIEITPAGGTATASNDGTPTLALDAGVIAKLDVPRLLLGGTFTLSGNMVDLLGQAASVTVDPGAVLTAGDVLLTTTSSSGGAGSLTVSSNATISTVGAGAAAFDLSDGYYFNNSQLGVSGAAFPVLVVSGGDIVFAPTASTAPGGLITVGDNAALLATGSLDFVAPSGTTVGIGAATLGGRYVNLQVSTLNLGSATAFADYNRLYPGELPIGLNLSTTQLSALLNGNASLGTPAAQSLVITASLATNIIGNATPLTEWAPNVAYAAGQTVLYNGSVYVCMAGGVSAPSGGPTSQPSAANAAFQFQNVSDSTGGDLNAFALTSGSTALVLNTPAIYGFGTTGDSVTIQAPSFTWSGVEYQNQAATAAAFVPVSSPPAALIAGSAANVAPALTISAQKIVLGYGPQTQPDDQTQLDRLIVGFAGVTLQATDEITANTVSSLSVYATQATYGQPGTAGNLTLAAPLVTTEAAAVLKVTAGGTLSLATPAGVSPAATGSITTLGGEIDLTATEIDTSTAIAVPAGRLTATAQDNITLGAGTSIDLAGRTTALFDQNAQSPGGTLLLESTAGSITEAAGAAIDVASPGSFAGSVAITALAGGVTLDGTVAGAAAAGQTAGSFTLIAGTLSAGGTGSAFDNLNTILDTGAFTGARRFEIAAGDIAIDQDIKASTLSVTADTGNITISADLDASGTGPGSIAVNAGGTLTLASTASLDAHATTTAHDSYGQDIDAENRAHVTLTSTHGSLLLDGGASINVSYPDASADPQGQLVLNAPRLATAAGVAAYTTGPISITGAESVAVYAFRTFVTHDSIGSISQTPQASPTGIGTTLSLDQIAAIDTAWANGLTAAAVEAQLGGLIGTSAGMTPSALHLRPGVEIDSTTQSHGTLTVIGDLDFSTLRISDPAGFGLQVVPHDAGSGEPGTVVFRAAGDLVVNGSITDGFAAPPDSKPGKQINPDRGWQILAPYGGFADPLNADLVLPASLSVTTEANGQTAITDAVVLGAGTSFDTTRAIALNYSIDINAANLNPNVTIPFNFRLSSDTIATTGFIATAAITLPGQKTPAYVAGDQVPANTDLPAGTLFAKNTLLPFPVQTGPNGTNVPAGTLLDIFSDSTVTLYTNTGPLTAGAFIPSNTVPIFLSTTGQVIQRLMLRPDLAGTTAQGYIYAIAAMLPPGAQSWNLNLVSGADQKSADRLALLPKSQLDGGALKGAPTLAGQAPGSLILDDQHYATLAASSGANVAAAFSVIRTGTGDLNLAVGGNFDQLSLYGIYTAGTQDLLPSPGGAPPSPTDAANAPFDLARQPAPGLTTILETDLAANKLITSTYQAYYPTDGGDLSMHVQGNATGDLVGQYANDSSATPSDAVGNWLWTQGGSAVGEQTAWWINFGTFVTPYLPSDGSNPFSTTPQLVGFQGIGTLGGGNLAVTIGGNAGQTTHRTGAASGIAFRGEGLVFAVASTGRLPAGASPVITGGGTLSVRIGGTLNPLDAADTEAAGNLDTAVDGDVIDLRGNITMSAGAIGRIETSYVQQPNDPRAANPFAVTDGSPYGGITVIPGDGSVAITTMRDLVVDGAADPGRVGEQNQTLVPTSLLGTDTSLGVETGFTLWQPTTSISLFASGGNVTPSAQAFDLFNAGSVIYATAFINDAATDYRFIYPPTLLVTAATGNIIYGAVSTGGSQVPPSIETMPSANGNVALLAGASIFANDEAVDISGANPALLSTPQNPTFVAMAQDPANALPFQIASNALATDEFVTSNNSIANALFAQEADTPTSDLHAGDMTPARFYAAGGDIVNFITGETITFNTSVGVPQPLATWYLAAKPVWILASADIVSSGTRPTLTPPDSQQNQVGLAPAGATVIATSSGNLFYNTAPSSISVVSAGQDILSGFFYVGGSSTYGAGVLEVDAGRNLYQAAANVAGVQALDFGSIKSIGALIAGSPIEPGADIATLAGVGADPDYSVFADLYLNPANLATPALQITDPENKDKVQAVYGGTDTVAGQSQLVTVLQQRYGFSGTPAQALAYYEALSPTAQQALLSPAANGNAVLSQLYAYLITSADYDGTEAAALAKFQTLPAIDQDVLLRKIFFEETNASGLQYNDPTSRFYQSYSRGRIAIDTFFLPLAELDTWLSKNFGYAGGQAGAAADFATLTPTLADPHPQLPFISAIFADDETPRTAAVSPAFTSLLGQTDDKSPGEPDGYTGSMTMYSGPVSAGSPVAPLLASNGSIATFDAGISTSSYGGTIQAFDPGGQIVLGVASSPAPGASSGIITNGPGDIDIFAESSVLLGKSRIFTTDGGSILIWSAGGDINAGIGAKTTIVYNPPIVSYDDGGDITETPAIPSSGAGIATLQPLPGIAAGNVNLIAPTGTIDAGEAGIRVSGNANFVGSLANVANIQVGGKTTGAPTVSVASLGAVAAAASAAGAATATAQSSAASRAQQEQPSVIEVDILSVVSCQSSAARKCN